MGGPILKRILFVDDDRNVVEGLARLLRPLRHDWQVTFAMGGQEAIDLLQSQSFDVVVTDIRMPTIDGRALLTHIHDLYPQIVRVVLSGHTELATAIAVVPLAHQFLTKPCRAEDLKGAVERAGAVREMLADDRIRKIIGTVDRLPTPPAVYTRLTETLSRADFTLGDVAAVIETDPGICAKILHLVNSSFFGTARKTTSMRDAIGYLGTSMIRHLVTSLAVFQVFGSGSFPRGFDPERIGKHGQLVATLARRMLQGNRQMADDAFAAGLLHEVGQLVLAAYAPELFQRAWSAAERDGVTLEVAELAEYQVTHAEAGAYLLALWGLPWSVVEAVARHHSAPAIGATALTVADTVYVANLVLYEAARPAGSTATPFALDATYLERIGVTSKMAQWRSWAEELIGKPSG